MLRDCPPKPSASKTLFPRKETIAAVYSRTVNAQTKLTQTLDERFPWCRDHAEDIKVMFQEYLRRKRSHNVVDYDDLLLYWRALLQSPAGDIVRRQHPLGHVAR